MGKPFELDHRIEVDATPEEVWEAIATGPGIDAWFMGRNEVEPREGGLVRMTFRGETEDATVTAWEPPTRFASRTAEGPDGAFHAFEYLVEGREKGSTVVRWVHSGFLGENWEAEYEGLSEGDPMYFDKLRVYLTYFRGRTATPVNVFGPLVPDRDHAWQTYHSALGLSGAPALDDQVHLTPAGLPEMHGVVDWVSRDFLGVRTDDGIYRFMHISVFGGPTGVGHHLFADGLDQTEAENAWGDWLNDLFA
ncbi:MAG TPA: SRPBCC domain-containing protein [Actinomycetota bacterium]|nr:SRPBCC domain-containing protein [Actinomycetota bacterium]